MTSAAYGAEPALANVQQLRGAMVLEFGTNWCGVCRAAQPAIAQALAAHPGLRHLKVEDGPGRPLGRHYRVKLWPTLVVLHNGRELARVVRPGDAASVEQVLQTALRTVLQTVQQTALQAAQQTTPGTISRDATAGGADDPPAQ